MLPQSKEGPLLKTKTCRASQGAACIFSVLTSLFSVNGRRLQCVPPEQHNGLVILLAGLLLEGLTQSNTGKCLGLCPAQQGSLPSVKLLCQSPREADP